MSTPRLNKDGTHGSDDGGHKLIRSSTIEKEEREKPNARA
jgi:hypothetical protein